MTATFWGSVRFFINPSHGTPTKVFKVSDRYGRVKFLSLNITTLLLADAALAALAVAPEYVPGGYWFLLFTSALEGLIGGKCRLHRIRQIKITNHDFAGRSAAIAALHAYLADCSSPATRSAFALSSLDVIPNQIPQITNILAISWASFHRSGIRTKFRWYC